MVEDHVRVVCPRKDVDAVARVDAHRAYLAPNPAWRKRPPVFDELILSFPSVDDLHVPPVWPVSASGLSDFVRDGGGAALLERRAMWVNPVLTDSRMFSAARDRTAAAYPTAQIDR